MTAGVCLVLLAGCKGGEQPTTTEPAPREEARPTDHLRSGELIEGKETAFGLTLPRDFYVERRLTGYVSAEGPGTPEDVAAFLRARVKDGKITVGAASTRFDNVHTPGDPRRALQITVEPDPRGGARSKLAVEDVTQPDPPPPDKRDPRSRMESVGLSEDGKILDPKKIQ